MIQIKLMLWWESRDPVVAGDARRLARFVSELPAFDRVYESWVRSPKAPQPLLPVPMSEEQARQIMRENVNSYDDGRPWPELGSHFRSGNAGPAPYNVSDPSIAVTEWRIGAYGRQSSPLPNHVFMQLAELRASTGRPWRASELKPMMKFLLDVWRPAEMCALCSTDTSTLPKVFDPTMFDKERILKPWIGWITYLPPDLAARAKYPADVEVETLDDGAALVTLCEEPFGKEDAQGLARLRALEAALRPIQS